MDLTLGQVIRNNANAKPHGVAISCGEQALTWRDFDQRSDQCAVAMRNQGVEPGDRVALLMKNTIEFYEILVACNKINAVTVGLNWRLSERELLEIISDASPSMLIVDGEAASIANAFERTNSCISSIVLGDEYECWLSDAPQQPLLLEPDLESVMLILYSSGTTGRPKGIMLTQRNFGFVRRMAVELFRMRRESVYLLGSPLFHVGGVATGTALMTLGGRTVLLRDVDPDNVLDTIEREHITHTFFVPAIIQRLVSAQEATPRDLSSLEIMAYGAAPMTQTLLHKAISVLECGVLGCYGMTETAGTVTALFPEEHQTEGKHVQRLNSVGRVLPWAEIKLVDPRTGLQAEVDSFGEIWVRSQANTPGYFNNSAATETTITKDGWLRTGDGACCDRDGFIYLKDRIKDMIISGGENVYPIEVENILAEHPDIIDSAVIGVPSERWGETVKALVVARTDGELKPEDVIEFTRARLAHYKCPTSVEMVAELPRTATGKVQKNALRSQYQ